MLSWSNPTVTGYPRAVAVTWENSIRALSEAGRHVDCQLLHPRQARKLATGFLAYAERHALILRTGPDTWTPSPKEVTIKVRPMEVAYDQAPLLYSWNELQELLSYP